MKRILLLLLFLSLSFWLWSQSFTFRDPAFVAGLAPSGAAVATWLPTDVANLTVWFDAGQQIFEDSAGTDVVEDGDFVGSWKNLGSVVMSATNILVNTMADHAPYYIASSIINSKPAVRFREYLDTTNYFLRSPYVNVDAVWGFNAFTLLFACALGTNAASSYSYPFLHHQNANSNAVYIQINNDSAPIVDCSWAGGGSSQGHDDNAIAISPMVPLLCELIHSNGVCAVFRTNGVTIVTRTSAITNRYPVQAPFLFGHDLSNNVPVGLIAEMVVYTNALTGLDITNARSYFSNKYNLKLY